MSVGPDQREQRVDRGLGEPEAELDAEEPHVHHQDGRRGHQRLALYLAVVDFRTRACDRYHRSASQKQVEATAARAMKQFRVLLRDDLGRGTRYGIRLLRLLAAPTKRSLYVKKGPYASRRNFI